MLKLYRDIQSKQYFFLSGYLMQTIFMSIKEFNTTLAIQYNTYFYLGNQYKHG